MNGTNPAEEAGSEGVGTHPDRTSPVDAFDLSMGRVTDGSGALWDERPDEAATVVRPVPGARPGETIATGADHRWTAYQTDGQIVAACYANGGLLRRDLSGWWTAGARGQRCRVDDSTVAAVVGTVPDGWPVLPEQAPLIGAETLTEGRPG